MLKNSTKEKAENPEMSRHYYSTLKMIILKLYDLIELSNGTVNMDTLLSVVPKGKVSFIELPDKVFDVDKDIDILEQLIQDYQKEGVKGIEKYDE